ncbi:MAG TPA: bifunctional oligoribonuclease/PAP phosphatase NrnA [Negativicutes bacterium]|nr:bifunctional oligoribonuclease/PAP phosphatase NrnA [Negativicutes bacterium]
MRGTSGDALRELSRVRSIVLTTHINPDGDALGSMIALYLFLKQRGVRVQMWLDDEIPRMYSFLPEIDKIIHPPTSSMQGDIIVVLDAGDAGRTGSAYASFRGRSLNIDHHLSNSDFADVTVIDEAVAATGVLILRMLEESGDVITKDMATCLYTAIVTDCGFFRYANTDAQTLHAAARLVSYGAEPHTISEQIQTMPLSKITALSRVLDTLEVSDCGKVATIVVPPGVSSADVEDTEGFIDYPRNIAGVEVAIMFKPSLEKETVKLSFRSRRLNVSELAQSMGGGGHARAAGCTLKGTVQDVKPRVLMRVLDALREAGL